MKTHQLSFYTGDKLPQAEGFSDVVIRPELQTYDPVNLLVSGRKQEDGELGPFISEPP